MIETKDPDYHPANEQHSEVTAKNFDAGSNVRLIIKLNLSSGAPYYEIIDTKGGPPLAVCVVRADMKFIALGVFEDLKFQIQKLHSVPTVASKLKQGVGDLARRLVH
jgi:hypothetical protein